MHRCHHLIHQHLLVVTPDGAGGWDELKRHRRRRHRLDQHQRWVYGRGYLSGSYNRAADNGDRDDEPDPPAPP